jgi:type II secretory pathway predicted ATPase ExeA
MNTNKNRFDATPDYETIKTEDDELHSRRIQTYSIETLKIGLEIDKIYVQHSQFVESLSALDRIFQIAREVKMPHGLRIVGPTGAGKSALFDFFKESLPQSSLFAPNLGCVRIRVGAHPTTGQLISALLDEYKYPFNTVTDKTIYLRKRHAISLVQEKGTRLIFLDEAQNLLRQVKRRNKNLIEPEATVFLRELMDTTHVALVLGGTDELDKLEDVDRHLADRITGRQSLDYFSPNTAWLAFMIAFVKACTWFDIKLIEDRKQASLLHIATHGSPRNFKRLLTEAVLVAAQAKSNSLQAEHLAPAFSLVYGSQSLKTSPYA